MEDGASDLARTLRSKVACTRGHFLYESGHHGDVWLDLNDLFVDARAVQRWARELARRAEGAQAQVVCGPMTGGAFLALALAAELGLDFVFAEQLQDESDEVRYRVPQSLRARLRGRPLLLVDDVVNAGSAWSATMSDVLECGATVAGFATLMTMGEAAREIAARHGAPLYSLAALERRMWAPETCPLCREGVPLSFGLLRPML